MLKYNGDLNVPVIYLITFKRDGRRYIGQTINFRRRLSEYRAMFSCPENIGASSALWAKHLYKTFGMLSLDKDFDIDVIEVINASDSEELRRKLNNLEVFYIEKYDTYDRTFAKGFNFTRGGAGDYASRVGKRNVLARSINRKDVNRISPIIYDPETNTGEMFTTLNSASLHLKIDKAAIVHAYHSLFMLKKRYLVIAINPECRIRLYKANFRKRVLAYRNLNVNDGPNLAAWHKETVRLLAAVRKAERWIQACDDEEMKLAKFEAFMIDIDSTIDLLCKALREYADDCADSEIYHVYDKIDKAVICTGDINIVSDIVRTKVDNLSIKIRDGRLIYGRYFIYFDDDDLRKKIVDKVVNSPYSPARGDRQDMWHYMCGYHAVNKIKNINTLSVSINL